MNRVLSALLLGSVCLSLLFPATAHAAPSSCGAWRVVKSPNPDPQAQDSNSLNGVAAISARDVWAVGTDLTSAAVQKSLNVTLIEHWDGARWSLVPSPNPGFYGNDLHGVAALSPTNVWAVGNTSTTPSSSQTLVEHWDGHAWRVIKSPPAQTYGTDLFAIAALSASDIWTVGISSPSSYAHTLIEHWDGSSWSIIKSPNRAAVDNKLFGVTAVSQSDVWAVGNSIDYNHGNVEQTLIEHWDGTAWRIVKSPSPGSLLNLLYGITSISATNVWAVGFSGNAYGAAATLVEHWDGTAWTIVPSPNPTSNSAFTSVAAVSASNIWAVGDSGQTLLTLTEQWNGSVWTIVPSPNPDPHWDLLLGVTAVPGTQQVWSVGFYAALNWRTLTEFYC